MTTTLRNIWTNFMNDERLERIGWTSLAALWTAWQLATGVLALVLLFQLVFYAVPKFLLLCTVWTVIGALHLSTLGG